jgi:hypothetical protein
MKNIITMTMAILDGEEHATKSLMNIARTSFTTSGKGF